MLEPHSHVRPACIVRAPRTALEVEPLIQLALRRSRRADFSNRSFTRSLERLLTACNEEADLSPFGVWALRFDVLRCLRNLLRFDELEARSPFLLSTPITAPAFITGLPRSGTTFMHRLILRRISALPFKESSVLHLHYQEVVSHPLRTIATVYRHCDLKLTEEAEHQMRVWLNRISAAAHRPRQYDLNYFGLDPHSLRDGFGPYTDKFKVAIE